MSEDFFSRGSSDSHNNTSKIGTAASADAVNSTPQTARRPSEVKRKPKPQRAASTLNLRQSLSGSQDVPKKRKGGSDRNKDRAESSDNGIKRLSSTDTASSGGSSKSRRGLGGSQTVRVKKKSAFSRLAAFVAEESRTSVFEDPSSASSSVDTHTHTHTQTDTDRENSHNNSSDDDVVVDDDSQQPTLERSLSAIPRSPRLANLSASCDDLSTHIDKYRQAQSLAEISDSTRSGPASAPPTTTHTHTHTHTDTHTHTHTTEQSESDLPQSQQHNDDDDDSISTVSENVTGLSPHPPTSPPPESVLIEAGVLGVASSTTHNNNTDTHTLTHTQTQTTNTNVGSAVTTSETTPVRVRRGSSVSVSAMAHGGSVASLSADTRTHAHTHSNSNVDSECVSESDNTASTVSIGSATSIVSGDSPQKSALKRAAKPRPRSGGVSFGALPPAALASARERVGRHRNTVSCPPESSPASSVPETSKPVATVAHTETSNTTPRSSSGASLQRWKRVKTSIRAVGGLLSGSNSSLSSSTSSESVAVKPPNSAREKNNVDEHSGVNSNGSSSETNGDGDDEDSSKTKSSKRSILLQKQPTHHRIVLGARSQDSLSPTTSTSTLLPERPATVRRERVLTREFVGLSSNKYQKLIHACCIGDLATVKILVEEDNLELGKTVEEMGDLHKVVQSVEAHETPLDLAKRFESPPLVQYITERLAVPPVHQFEKHKFTKPTNCSYCGRFIWALTEKSALRCEQCRAACHAKCAESSAFQACPGSSDYSSKSASSASLLKSAAIATAVFVKKGTSHTSKKEPAQLSQSTTETNDDEDLMWNLDASELEVGEKIGQGGFGAVYRGTFRGKEVAVKKILTDKATDDDMREIEVMAKITHPSIVRFIGASVSPDILIVTELCHRGSLDSVLTKEGDSLTYLLKLTMALECARGMLYLHSLKPPILHRDLKAQNLLVKQDYSVRIADFGLSKSETSKLNTKVGDLNWCAPEILSSSAVYSPKADVYAFGCVMYELLTHHAPYANEGKMAMMRKIVSGTPPDIPSGTARDYKKLMDSCWREKPSQRPPFSHIVKSLERMVSKEEKASS